MAFFNLNPYKFKKPNQICSRCVMDDTDPTIVFNDNGECSYCNHFDMIKPHLPSEIKSNELELMADQIKSRKAKDSEYDCIIGFSGGLDSSYLLHICVNDMKLKPLVLHVDAGWNTQHASYNIRCMIDALKLDLHTEVIEWSEMRDMQLSFLKSGIQHLDIPQDMAFFSSLYKFAIKNNVKSVLTGANYATEVIREPEAWGAYPGNDPRLVKNIVKRFSNNKLLTFPMVNSLVSRIVYRIMYGMVIYKPLNVINYTKKEAEDLLINNYKWKPFKHKHHESFFTRFLESYYLPTKYGIDRRKAHFSSLILVDQMTRDDALKKLETCALSHIECKEDFEFLADKLEISTTELYSMLCEKPSSVKHFKSYRKLMIFASKAQGFFSQEKRLYK